MKHRQQKKNIAPLSKFKATRNMQIAICLFLVVATLMVYWQVLDHGFLNYDDGDYVTKNLKVQSGLTSESFVWAFTTSHFSNWHPVTWLSHMLDYQLYGSHPKGHHLTSLLFHITNTLLLFLVLNRMTGALWQSGFVAALFALHPFNVESVAWIAERKNVLSTFFWLLTMWAYIQYTEKPNIKKYSLMALFFALGLMAKPMLVTLPFVLLMMDYWPLRRLKKDYGNIPGENTVTRCDIGYLVREKIPLFLMVVGSSIATFITQKGDEAVKGEDLFPLTVRLVNALVSYLEYLGKAVWPLKLAVFYPHPGDALSVWEGIMCGIALVGITALSLKLIKKAPYFAFGWFWYLGTLVPVLGIVQAFKWVHGMADRYTYIPLIGIFIIAAWGIPELIAKWHFKEKALAISAGALIPALMIVTSTQVSLWKNDITLFKHAVDVNGSKYPGIALAHNNLGIALEGQRMLNEAISQYKTAIKIKPDFAESHNNLGNILFALRETEEAVSYFQSALKLDPEYAMAHNNLGIALEFKGEVEEAIAHYRQAVKLKPDLVLAQYNLGIVLKEKGELEEAISHYRTAIKFKPDFALAHNNLGNALLAAQKIEEAIAHYKEAIKIEPDLTLARNNLEMALLRSKEKAEN